MFLAILGGAATFILVRDGKGWVLLLALAVGVVLWGVDELEAKCIAGGKRVWRALEGWILPVAIISLAVFAACFPTLYSYFVGDDFAYLHHFHGWSWDRFLQLFHTDMAQILWGEPRQELRPFYGLYYMVSYQLWGLNPLGYHLANAFLHIVNCSLVFLIVRELAPRESWRAGFAALLFAVLPLHSDIFYWATGAPTELIPVFFYLLAFLCFMRFRATESVKYLVITVVVFAGCLASKETAVTLPVMLASYDLFRRVTGEKGVRAGNSLTRKARWRGPILTYLPFAILLLAYLVCRRIVCGQFVRENTWRGHLPEGVPDSAGLTDYLALLWRYVWGIQSFNLQHLLLPFSALVLAVVLGLYLAWIFSLLRRESECCNSIAVTLYFGLVWYLISNLPLLIVDPGIWHLYLPAVGPCIATAFLAFPDCHEPRRVLGYLRLVGFVLLVCLSASQLWRENTRAAHWGEMAAKMTTGLRSALEVVPKESLVVLWPGKSFSALDGTLPYALQEPFTATDLYNRVHLVPDDYLYGRTVSEWREHISLAVRAGLEGPSDVAVEIHLFGWDERRNCLGCKKRVISRALLRSCVTESQGRESYGGYLLYGGKDLRHL